jgi:hypothetical protein
MGVQGRMGLPQHVDRVALLQTPELAQGDIYAVVTPQPGHFDAEIVDTKGNCYLRLSGYRTVAIPNAVDADRLKALQSRMSGVAILAA